MKEFIQDCTDQTENLVKIGDDDSGNIVAGITINKQTPVKNIKKYSNFGLSIIKQNGWHITFRHPTFNSRQPSGHFHQDQLAITLSLDGTPILVDPGSHRYTSHTTWRNSFRSAKNHNTFYLKDFPHNDKKLEEQDLFQLSRRPAAQQPIDKFDNQGIKIQDSHDEYSFVNLRAHRSLSFDPEKELLTIYDWYKAQASEEKVGNFIPKTRRLKEKGL